jgi:hypothetical protein
VGTRHYTARVRCPKCGHAFTVCLHAIPRPELPKSCVVMCPENGSKIQVPDSAFAAVESCPDGAVIIRQPR